MRDEFDEPQPAIDDPEAGATEAAMAEAVTAQAETPQVEATEAPALASPAALPVVPAGIQLLNRDFLTDVANLPDASIDLILADPPYGLGKDYGNDSDMRSGDDFIAWTRSWLELAIPKLKPSGSLYIFCTWQYAPEIFCFLKTRDRKSVV